MLKGQQYLELQKLRHDSKIDEEFVLCTELLKLTGESEEEYLLREIREYGPNTQGGE